MRHLANVNHVLSEILSPLKAAPAAAASDGTGNRRSFSCFFKDYFEYLLFY